MEQAGGDGNNKKVVLIGRLRHCGDGYECSALVLDRKPLKWVLRDSELLRVENSGRGHYMDWGGGDDEMVLAVAYPVQFEDYGPVRITIERV